MASALLARFATARQGRRHRGHPCDLYRCVACGRRNRDHYAHCSRRRTPHHTSERMSRIKLSACDGGLGCPHAVCARQLTVRTSFAVLAELDSMATDGRWVNIVTARPRPDASGDYTPARRQRFVGRYEAL